MSTEMAGDIPTILSEYTHDLEWSLQPVFLWMQICGTPMVPFRSSPLRHYASLCVGIIIMIWILASNVFFISVWRLESHKAGWIFSVFRLYPPLTNITIAFSFIFSAQINWKSMWRIAVEIENSIGFNSTFYSSLRKISMAAMTVLVSVNHRTITTLSFKNAVPNDIFLISRKPFMYH